MEWVGAEDTTPGGEILDGTSTLTVNGVAVDGILAGPLTPTGSAGYDPHGFTNAGPAGWLSWHADLGPNGYAIVPPALDHGLTLAVSGWDSPARQTNGASLTLILEKPTCVQETQVDFKTGVNWYYFGTPGQAQTELLVYPVDPEPLPRAARMYFSHAGTDKTQTACRGGAIWMVAGEDPATMPGPTDYDLVATGDRNGDGVARGYGINRAVELFNDPFTSSALPCAPTVNPTPDEPYETGHPYPGGAATAPYRAVSLNPPTGGDLGAPGEWGIVEAVVTIPANASWIAFQLESEADQNGESGSWVGGGVFIILPPAAIGDRVWLDVDRNGIQDVGEPGMADVPVTLRDGGGNSIAATTTDAAGLYGFDQLVTGAYALQFGPLPDGYIYTAAHVETGPEGDAGDSDADPVTGMTPATNLDPGEVDLTWDAGLVRLRPAIAIEKLPDLQQVEPGGTATFTIIVHNVGELDLVDVTVTDPLAPGCDRAVGDLAVDASTTYTCTVPGVLVDFTNVATVTGKDRFGEEVADDDDAVVDVLPLIDVTKLATPDIVNTDGGLVSFAVTVHNRVDEPLILDTLVDDVFGDLRGQGTCALPQTIPVGGSYTCNFNGVIPPGDMPHHDTVTAEARDDEGNRAQADDDATVIRIQPELPSRGRLRLERSQQRRHPGPRTSRASPACWSGSTGTG
ncbi:MAG: SdrD B-like domain-containing protein [Caldilineaceae bacterium]